LKNFLGENEFGKNCTITNMNQISIRYDEAEKSIIAHSREPLIIENKLQNYKITYDLHHFQAVYKRDVFRADNLIKSLYYGVSFFENLDEVTKKHKKLRDQAFIGSIQHFFWSLIHDPSNEYAIHDGEAYYNPNQFIELLPMENAGHYYVNFLGNGFRKVTKIDEETLTEETYYAFPLQVRFKKQITSFIEFRSQRIKVDKHGNYFPINGITIYGEMIDYKIGNMLPINFMFEN
jgi:hypothetical protein